MGCFDDFQAYYNAICPNCDPDDIHENFASLHQRCFEYYTSLIIMRLDYGLHMNILNLILGLEDLGY